jgi:hypothetical protein
LIGYVAGGTPGAGGSISIQNVTFSNDSIGTLSATLGLAKYNSAGGCSSTSGYILGGQGTGNGANVQKLTLSNETISDIGNILVNTDAGTAYFNSNSKCYRSYGFTGYNYLGFEFATETDATLSSAINHGAAVTNSGVNSNNKGYIGGGNISGSHISLISDFGFSNETGSSLTATLTSGKSRSAGLSYRG